MATHFRVDVFRHLTADQADQFEDELDRLLDRYRLRGKVHAPARFVAQSGTNGLILHFDDCKMIHRQGPAYRMTAEELLDRLAGTSNRPSWCERCRTRNKNAALPLDQVDELRTAFENQLWVTPSGSGPGRHAR
jgi:hypothetical protein